MIKAVLQLIGHLLTLAGLLAVLVLAIWLLGGALHG